MIIVITLDDSVTVEESTSSSSASGSDRSVSVTESRSVTAQTDKAGTFFLQLIFVYNYKYLWYTNLSVMLICFMTIIVSTSSEC